MSAKCKCCRATVRDPNTKELRRCDIKRKAGSLYCHLHQHKRPLGTWPGAEAEDNDEIKYPPPLPPLPPLPPPPPPQIDVALQEELKAVNQKLDRLQISQAQLENLERKLVQQSDTFLQAQREEAREGKLRRELEDKINSILEAVEPAGPTRATAFPRTAREPGEVKRSRPDYQSSSRRRKYIPVSPLSPRSD